MQTNTNQPPEDDRDPVTGEPAGGGYTPPDDAPIPLATPKPKLKTLDKKKVAVIGGVVAVFVAIAFITAFAPKGPREAEQQVQEQPAMTSQAEAVNALPGDYAAAAQQRAERVPQLGQPYPGDAGQMRYHAEQSAGVQPGTYAGSSGGTRQLTPAQQYIQQQYLEQMRRAADAAKADTSFGSGGVADGAAGLDVGGLGRGVASPDMLAARLAALGGPAMPDGKAERDAANRQDDKRDFLDEKGDDGVLANRLQQPVTPYMVGAGTVIPALFLTGVNSDLPGMVTAQVSQNVYDTITGSRVVIPQGSQLIGMYDSRITFGQSRVLLVWQRLRFPNGTSLNLEGMPGVDLSGYAGVSDKVNNHWGKVAGSVVLSSVLAGAMAVSQGDTFSAFQKDASQAAVQGAAQQVNQVGSQIVQRSINVQPTLEIRPGQRVGVMVNKDLPLAPYEG